MFGLWKRSLQRVESPIGSTLNPYDIEPVQDVPVVRVIGPWHPKMAAHLKKKNVRGLFLNPHEGFRSEDYGFLDELYHLELLSIGDPMLQGYKGPVRLPDLPRLRHLSAIFPVSERVNFGGMPDLESCSLKWSTRTNEVFQARLLKRLYLTSLNWKKADQLAQLTTLENLDLSHSGIKSFAPLSELRNLTRLSLSVCRSLENLKGIENLSKLKLLHLGEVHHLYDLDRLAALEGLEVLVMSDCGDLASLGPLENLKKLKAVSFEGARTTVVDGDLTPLTKLPNLSMVSFGQRRHYTHRATKSWNWKNLGEPDTMLVAA